MIRARVCFAFTAALALALASAARADIITTGDATYDRLAYYLGRSADATIQIDHGTPISSFDLYLGYSPGYSGTATVTGSPSLWMNYTRLDVGYSGSGSLNIEAGGEFLNCGVGYIGSNTGSAGAVVVSGIGSMLTNYYDLYVGYSGSGSLTVSDGGLVRTNVLWASLDDLHGNGTITTYGAVFDGNLAFDSTHGPIQAMSFGSGGTLNLISSGSNALGAGYRGAGTLSISQGQSVASSNGYLGYNSGSTGTATVSGTGSKWTIGSDLFVGYSGAGSLTVADKGLVSANTLWASLGDLHGNGTIAASGAVLDGDLVFDSAHGSTQAISVGSGGSLNLSVSNSLGVGYRGNGTLGVSQGQSIASAYGYLGYNSGATGSATVIGTGSKWTIGSDLYVGKSGSGSLTVSNGGQVTAKTLWASLNDLHGNGTITTTGGAVLDADLLFDAAHGLTQSMAFGSGGTLNLSVTSTNILGTGYHGGGTLRIAEARSVASSYGYLGYNAGSTGSATVTGTGSKWTISSDLYVGHSGNGTLNLESVGQVSTTRGYLGFNPGSAGTATVTGTGSKWTNSSNLYIGNSGSGTLNIQNGGQVSNTCGYLGYNAGASGAVTVTGTGSKWTNNSDLYIGKSGSGSLTVADGGLVTTPVLWASLGDLHGNGTITTGGVILDADLVFDTAHAATQSIPFGSGGTLNLSMSSDSPLGAGYKTSGTLRISQGLNITSAEGYLGYSAGSTGTATVTGTGSKWTHSSGLQVGSSGSGTLNIEAGGQVTGAYVNLAYVPGSVGTATVRGTGSIWTNSSSLVVGECGTGTMNIEAGGRVSSAACYLGDKYGSTGTVNVTGTGATWNNSSELRIGSSGTGTMNIGVGGFASTNTTYLGYDYGSTGTATVAGSGAQWSSSDLYVGRYGSGSLTVSDGGRVSTYGLFASPGDLHGNGTITVYDGAVLDTALVFDSAHGLTQSMPFGSGGLLSLTVSGYRPLGAGYKGAGTMRIAQGRNVASWDGYLGYHAGSTGTATVTGTGSKWTNRYGLYVGHSGSGMLNIEAGAEVSSTSGYLGYNYGAIGAATVTGPWSTWTNASDLYVGKSGSGSLTVSNGGQVTTTTLWASLSDLHGDGWITAGGGAVLDADLVFDSAHGLMQSLAFGSGGTLSLTAGSGYKLGAGYKTSGTLRIAQGSSVTSTEGHLGYNFGSTGTAIVTGIGSKWTTSSNLYVGNRGSGALTIEAGGQVSDPIGYVGYDSSNYYGTGAGKDMGPSVGAVTVTGTGSTWTNSSALYVGYVGTGKLTVEAGGLVTDSYGCLGHEYGSTGDATVTGAGSKWTSKGEFNVGYSGSGTLNIEAGGQVTSSSSYGTSCLGFNSSAKGTATVTGAGSRWTNNYFYVGYSGSGTLTIERGGQVSTGTYMASVGGKSGSTGVVTVTGAGSNWTSGTSLSIGSSGVGTLNIEDGGQVTSTSGGSLAGATGSTGTAIVTGTGSKWTSGTLYVGNSGNGTLNIGAGGQVTSASSYLGYNSGSAGSATVMGTGSKWTNFSDLYVGSSGTGMLNLADRAQVTARSVTINSSSVLRLHVSGNDMLVLGDAATIGKLTSNGTVGLYADAFGPTGAYTPISEVTRRAMSWTGTGSYNGIGGVWDPTAKTLTFSAPTSVTAGATHSVASAERLLVTDPATGHRFGAAFGAVAGSVNFSAAPVSSIDVTAMGAAPEFAGSVLDAWSLQTNLSGSEAMLSLDIGLGVQKLAVWRLQSGVWSRYTPKLLTYDAQGIVSFSASDFSGYAATGIPELLAWDGNSGAGNSSLWDNATANFLSSSGRTASCDYRNLVFDDRAVGSTDVTRAGTLRPRSVVVDNSARNYTLGGSGTLIGPMRLTKRGIGTLTLSGPVDYTGGTVVEAGLLKVGTPLNSMLEINGGAVEATADLSVNAPLKLAAGATLKLNASQHTVAPQLDPAAKVILNASAIELSIQDSPAPGPISPATLNIIWTLVRSGYNGTSGAWTGNGITTTAVTNTSLNGLGLMLSGDPALEAQTLTVREMILGDVNGDNKVTIGDLMVALNSANYQQDGTWLNGDVNYDGKVTIGDVMLMLNSTRYQQDYNPANAPAQIAALEEAGLGELADRAVPEPGSLGVLAVAALSVLGRRRRSFSSAVN